MNKSQSENYRPDNFDSIMSVVRIKSWLALLTVSIVVGATLVWSLFGKMQIREDVLGILASETNIYSVYSHETALILDFSLKPGDYVENGQVIARLDQAFLVDEINAMIAEGIPENEINAKRDELLNRSRVITYKSGFITEVFVRPGDYIKEGTKLLTITETDSLNSNLECTLYVPIERIKNIRKGMNVDVFPNFADKETYGNMIGTVEYISEQPATLQNMYMITGSDDMSRALLNGKTCFEVTVSLVTSEESKTGYKWTSSMGPPNQIANRSLCTSSIIIKELKPIDVFYSGN